MKAKKTKVSLNAIETLIFTLNKLLQGVRIHDHANDLVRQSAGHFIRTLERFFDSEASVVLETSRGRFYFQDQKMLQRYETTAFFQTLMDFFEALGVGGFSFSKPPEGFTASEVVAFAQSLHQALGKENPRSWISQSIKEKGLKWVRVIESKKKEEEVEDGRLRARKMYSYAYNSIVDVTEKILSGQRVGIRKPMRIIQNMTDMVIGDDPVLLGLSTIKDYDNYTFNHSVNVSILSMCLGQKIGLSKHSLVRLGICGLFHDLGKIDIDVNIINKPGRLTDDEFEKVQQHSLNGVRQILKLQAYRKIKSQIVLAPFEHHLKYNLSGYPKVRWSKPLSLFGRIISIADVYDALTSVRIYRPVAISQDEALKIMLQGSGTDFDPVLLKWFVNMIGTYPVGTVLELDDGRMGMVLKGLGEGFAHRPRLLLLVPDDNGGYRKGREINLAEKNQQTGDYQHKIARTYNPAQLGIRTVDFLM